MTGDMKKAIPLLSIAIATYNRKELLLRNVNNILTYEGDDIEVVVTDDASPDGTTEYLRERIRDPRFSVVRHKTNYGGFKTFIDCLFNTSGRYVMYSNDRDFILPKSLPGLLDILRSDDYMQIITANDDKPRSDKLTVYEKGFESLIHNPIATHPTGGIYNGEVMRRKFKAQDFFPYSRTVFPERFLSREMCCKGKTALYDSAVYHNGSHYMLSKGGKDAESGVIPEGIEEKFYFHPQMSWLLFRESFLQIFDKLPIKYTEEQKMQYANYLFDFLFGRLPDYKRFRNDQNDWIHYKLKPRYVTLAEVLGFYGKYVKALKKLLEEREENDGMKDVFKKNEFRYFLYIIKGCLIVDMEELRDGRGPWSPLVFRLKRR